MVHSKFVPIYLVLIFIFCGEYAFSNAYFENRNGRIFRVIDACVCNDKVEPIEEETIADALDELKLVYEREFQIDFQILNLGSINPPKGEFLRTFFDRKIFKECEIIFVFSAHRMIVETGDENHAGIAGRTLGNWGVSLMLHPFPSKTHYTPEDFKKAVAFDLLHEATHLFIGGYHSEIRDSIMFYNNRFFANYRWTDDVIKLVKLNLARSWKRD